MAIEIEAGCSYTLDDVKQSKKPVYLKHYKNGNFSGWAMYDGQKGPYCKFKTFETRILILEREYNETWVCWPFEV